MPMSCVCTRPAVICLLKLLSPRSLTIAFAASESDDHFSDAQSAPEDEAVAASPVPKLRVEKVDDEPSYGEVPGTEAYEKRTGDAVPDEIAVIPDEEAPSEPQSANESEPANDSSASTPGGQPIPKTVVDETPDEEGSKTHHYHEDLHKADATPDFVRKADGTGEANTVPADLETTGEATGTAAKSS